MPKPPAKSRKMVWRISASAPKGEWVDANHAAPSVPKLAEPEVSSGSWVTSSFDLLNGTDIVEHRDAMTPEQFKELFKTTPTEPKDPKR